MTPPVPATPQVGDPVLCDGELCQIREFATRFSGSTGTPVEMVRYEGRRFVHYGTVADLRWDDEAGAWYLWGRCLSHAQARVVIVLRDRGYLPARDTRQPGHAPAGGEHLNLWLSLFKDSAIDWEAEVALAVVKKPLGPAAAAAIAAYEVRFQSKLARGYADPDADDSEEAAP